MKAFNYSILMVVIWSLFASCDTSGCSKAQYIHDFEQFVSTLEGNYLNYTEEAWKKSDTEMEEYNVRYHKLKNVLTKDEQAKVDKLKGRYYACVTKYKADKIMQKTKGVYNQVEGFIEGITK